MKKFGVLLFAIVIVSMSSCKYQSNNVIEQKDVNAGNEYVYGVHPDSAARQLKNKYTADPKQEARANAIREKLGYKI